MVIPGWSAARTPNLGNYRPCHENTIPTATGGISGKQLNERNLPLVYNAAHRGLNVIAGGGIYSYKDVVDYRNAGADHFSISTAFFSRP